MKVLALAAVALLLMQSDAFAWGAAGHAIVAEMAQRQLKPEALLAIRQLLGGEVSLASISNWADTIAMIRPETRPWHFVNIREGSTGYDAPRDCPNGQCIVEATAREFAVLRDRSAGNGRRAEALRFVVHLVTDIHQPLHCATRGDDLGASLLPVTYVEKFTGIVRSTNLHAFWDVTVVEAMTYDWGETVARLARVSTSPEDTAGSPADWAFQTHRLAFDLAYRIPADGALTDEYQAAAARAVDVQFARATARLVKLLEEALTGAP